MGSKLNKRTGALARDCRAEDESGGIVGRRSCNRSCYSLAHVVPATWLRDPGCRLVGTVLVRPLCSYPTVSTYFTLTSTVASAANWPGAAKGLPSMQVPMVLLGRMAVAEDWQGLGIGRLLLAAARQIAATSMPSAGGICMAVDQADEELVAFCAKYRFRRVDDESLRVFLPLDSLC